MDRIRIATIFGTRPEAIKMVPLIRELKRHSRLDVKVCVTAQHREMMDSVLQAFRLVPDYDLDVMTRQQSLGGLTARLLDRLDGMLEEVRPHMILVHGDTTTTFAAGLAAYYRRIPVGHVEAGLRTGDRYAPFPEEMNRLLTGAIAELHFAPTEQAAANLLAEGKPAQKVFVTGNTVIDALAITVCDDYHHSVLEKTADKRMILVTAHRRENWGEPMERMFRAIRRLMDEHPTAAAVFPVHLNPRVRQAVQKTLQDHERIHLIPPVDVFHFHNLMARSYLIYTDSGGIQEEAPSLGVPVLVMRETTERPEGVTAGSVRLVGNDEERLFQEGDRILRNPEAHREMAHTSNPYGDGQASRRIAEAILHHFGLLDRPPFPFAAESKEL